MLEWLIFGLVLLLALVVSGCLLAFFAYKFGRAVWLAVPWLLEAFGVGVLCWAAWLTYRAVVELGVLTPANPFGASLVWFVGLSLLVCFLAYSTIPPPALRFLGVLGVALAVVLSFALDTRLWLPLGGALVPAVLFKWGVFLARSQPTRQDIEDHRYERDLYEQFLKDWRNGPNSDQQPGPHDFTRWRSQRLV